MPRSSSTSLMIRPMVTWCSAYFSPVVYRATMPSSAAPWAASSAAAAPPPGAGTRSASWSRNSPMVWSLMGTCPPGSGAGQGAVRQDPPTQAGYGRAGPGRSPEHGPRSPEHGPLSGGGRAARDVAGVLVRRQMPQLEPEPADHHVVGALRDGLVEHETALV